jgi:two-component system, NtrC family, sensor kinase
MFLSRDGSPASSAGWQKCCEKVKKNLVQRTRQLKHANQELASQIAERKRAQEALRQAEQKYRSIFENAVLGIFQTTPQGRYIACNPTLARIYGYESSEQLLTTLTDIRRQLYVEPRRRDEFVQQLQSSDAVSEFESQVYRKDGSIIWISENARSVYSDDGTLLYYEGFVTDITQRKLAEASLRQSEAQLRAKAEQLELALSQLKQVQTQLIQQEKMSSLGQLVAGVAHEINNPVNFVCGNLIPASQYVEDLLNLLKLYGKYYPQPAPEIQREAEAIDLEFLIEDFPKALSSMQLGADRIRQIVQSLQHFSRTDVEIQSVDLHKGIDSTLLILHNRLKSKGDRPGITVIKEYAELPVVECYAGLLNQVFMNLLSNAIDAIEESYQKRSAPSCSHEPCMALEQNSHQECAGSCSTVTKLAPTESPPADVEQSRGIIWIRTEVRNDDSSSNGSSSDLWAVIRIIDNGLGMEEELRERIFDPFFTTKPAGKGTGLGLAISYQIVVEKHNGQLRCISAPEQGTEFTIEIPIRHHEQLLTTKE